jgi:hypothetical protein
MPFGRATYDGLMGMWFKICRLQIRIRIGVSRSDGKVVDKPKNKNLKGGMV